MDNVTLIGTSHIARQSVKEVKEYIEKEKPDIVAVELDAKRLPALFAKKRERMPLSAIFKIGMKGYLFSVLGAWAERKLGELVGMKPGAEMKQALILAKKHKLKIALIDQDIERTLKRLSQQLTWKEKWRFVEDVIKGLVFRKPLVEFDLRTVPESEVITKMVNHVKKRYPNIYNVLIKERNKVMVKNLVTISRKNPDKRIVAVIGAGHKEDVQKDLNKIDVSPKIKYTLPSGAKALF